MNVFKKMEDRWLEICDVLEKVKLLLKSCLVHEFYNFPTHVLQNLVIQIHILKQEVVKYVEGQPNSVSIGED